MPWKLGTEEGLSALQNWVLITFFWVFFFFQISAIPNPNLFNLPLILLRQQSNTKALGCSSEAAKTLQPSPGHRTTHHQHLPRQNKGFGLNNFIEDFESGSSPGKHKSSPKLCNSPEFSVHSSSCSFKGFCSCAVSLPMVKR